ncbi:cysteine desulfurase [Scopulibacillus darangshiensis]|uniref:Cysteine desulfurase n=1 Tax=Scopulibacillus darangshiensis TaxID=442528 RepID=A0A4R2ND58_9BACL|nr:IscS subfamily cysteine desulfurase [Scopulibacillus darangshiensis]TCP19123.1 cysteine desulfurase [Scopulibacillus darangshiensis]
MIYLDYAATTPVSDHALKVFHDVSKRFFANTMSLHNAGTDAADLLEVCRGQLAELIHGKKEGVYFTSGGSESNQLAIEGLAKAHQHKGKHIVASPGEHASVLNTLERLENAGYKVSYLPLDENGKVTLQALEDAIREDTILAAVGHVNSEIGTIQDIEAIAPYLHDRGVLFHCDAVQSFGKLDIDVVTLKISSLSISSHKIYGPKGVGACYIDPEIPLECNLPNGTHERGFRQGTVNLPGIASFVTAAMDICRGRLEENNRIAGLRETFILGLKKASMPIEIESAIDHTIPHTLALSVKGIEGQYVMLECNRMGVAISTGTACKVGQSAPSKTMLAMGRSEDEARELVRLSFGKETTREDVERAIEVLKKIITENQT